MPKSSHSALLSKPMVVAICGMVVAACSWPTAILAQQTPVDGEYFEKEVRPILVRRCYECHGPQTDAPKGGLRLDSLSGLLQGGDTGPALQPGLPESSLLIDAIKYGDLYQMPPKSRLPEQEVAVLTRWVQGGAPWPDSAPDSSDEQGGFDWQTRKAAHWAWRPLHAGAPQIQDQPGEAAGPIDRYLMEKLQQVQLHYSGWATREERVRRACFDLLGLPPTPDQVRRFVDDRRPEAFERLVDELLASPHFGERWGRHWLDLVRFAESRGHEFDYDIPNAYEYRDYVIRAWNADLPYDQLLAEHVAGDLLEPPRVHPQQGFNESILATGFWFLGEWVHSPVDIRQDETNRFDNMIDVFGKTFLGLTIGCARCHDHKFDAISQRDYYALMGYLQSTGYRQARFQTQRDEQLAAERLHLLRASGTGRDLAAAVAEQTQAARKHIAALLLAAREVLQSSAGPLSPADSLEAVARQRQLSARELAFWIQELQSTEANGFWAPWIWECEPDAVHEAVLDRLRQLAPSATPPQSLWGKATVVADYTQGDAPQWLSDGWAFGLGPIAPGQWLLEGPPPTPLSAVAVWGYVRRDPDWPEMKLAAGVQNDAGQLAAYQRAGQTFRTPTFTIESGRLHYLLQGRGLAYLVVDSHRMVNGPLHGQLLHSFQVDGAPAWVAHHVEDYRGHRAHLELVPQGNEPLRLYAVVDSPQAPGLGLPEPAPYAAAALIAAGQVASSESLADGYAQLLDRAARWLSSATPAEQPRPETAVLAAADWLVRRRHDWLAVAAESNAVQEENAGQLAQRYLAERRRIVDSIPTASRTAPAMWEGSGEDEHVLIRGNHRTPGALARRGLPLAMGGPSPGTPGSGRLELVAAMLAPDNPFPARVMANRVWAHLMGRGIVASVDNFGALGLPPTHPELLDYLATRLRDSGWSVKSLIREIMLSRAYQQSSQRREDAELIDPTNRWWHRYPLRRLEGESVRDALLFVSGRLDASLCGPSIPVYLTPFMQGRGRPGQSGPLDGAGRRSIYTAVRRNFLSPMMLAFDMPQPFSTVGDRNVSNVPAQALILLNDPMVLQQTRLWAERLIQETPGQSDQRRVQQLYLQAYAHPASPAALSEAIDFLASQRHSGQSLDEAAPWANLCHVLVNVKEFIYLR